jgi:uncharacterized protein DUF6894
MARYCFKARYGGAEYVDDLGEEFATQQEAEAYAAVVANELGRNNPQAITIDLLSEEGILLTSLSPAKS